MFRRVLRVMTTNFIYFVFLISKKKKIIYLMRHVLVVKGDSMLSMKDFCQMYGDGM